MATLSAFRERCCWLSIQRASVDLPPNTPVSKLSTNAIAAMGLRYWVFHAVKSGNQEPGSDSHPRIVWSYQVSFPMFSKIQVNGDETHPVYQALKSAAPGLLGSKIKWNFTKFLVGRMEPSFDASLPSPNLKHWPHTSSIFSKTSR